MLREAVKIIDAVNTREKELADLRTRVENDYKLWRLEAYRLGKPGEYDNYTSNEPRNLANKVIEKLASAPKQFRIPLDVDNEKKRRCKANAERFIYGCENLANSRLQSMLSPNIQSLSAFFSTLRGWIVKFAYIYKNEKGNTVIDIKLWDILQTTWELGASSLLWVCFTRMITKAQAQAEYDIDINGKETKLYDFWDDEVNAVIIDNKFVKEPQKHELDHIPIIILPVGAVPFIQSAQITDTIKDTGESIYGSNRNVYPQRNKMMTYRSTIVGQSVHNPLAISSSGGHKTLERSPYYKGAVVLLDSDKKEEIKPIFTPIVPRDIDALDAHIMRDISIGGMPPIAGGELNFQLPYAGINLLIEAASSVLLPRQLAMEHAFNWMGRELLTQYAKGVFGKLRLHGRDGSNEAFDIELSPEDIEGDWFPETKLLPVLPEDKPSQYAMAQVAVQNDLLSPETASDVLLGIRDPDLEQQKIRRAKAKKLPFILLTEMAKDFYDEGRPDIAQALLAERDKIGLQPEGKRGQGEAVRPEFATGMPEEVMPPEMMGRRQFPPGVREQITQDMRLAHLGLVRES